MPSWRAGRAPIHSTPAAMPPERKRRAQSFFGLHFDFHADDRAGIGAGLTEAAIDAVLARVRPDYVQCDCKGHWGLASYPTRVGTPAPGLAGDPLRTWRDATARRGVALYVHYSGLFDKMACSRGPGWARTRPDGTLDTENASSIGPYARDLLVPALDQVRRAGAAGGGARDRPGRRHPVLLPAETGRFAGALAGRADGAPGPLLPAPGAALLSLPDSAAGGAAALHLRLLPPHRGAVHGRRSIRALVRGTAPRPRRAGGAARQPAQRRRPGRGAARATAGRTSIWANRTCTPAPPCCATSPARSCAACFPSRWWRCRTRMRSTWWRGGPARCSESTCSAPPARTATRRSTPSTSCRRWVR